MIVQFKNKEEFEKIIHWCEDSIDKSLHDDGSIYILVGSGNKDEEIKWVELWKK